MPNRKTEQKKASVEFNREILNRTFLWVPETELYEVLMNGSMISYEGRCGPLVLKNVVGMSTKKRILPSLKEKLLDGCNPGNQSPGKYCTHFSPSAVTDRHCRHSLPCCAWWVCCPQSRNCLIWSRKDAPPFGELEGEKEERMEHGRNKDQDMDYYVKICTRQH